MAARRLLIEEQKNPIENIFASLTFLHNVISNVRVRVRPLDFCRRTSGIR